MNADRQKKIEMKLKEKANNGNFSARMSLYISEAEMLQNNGFEVLLFSYSKSKKRKLPYDIFWSSPFDRDITNDVFDYLSGKMEHFPDVETFAQRLYLVAMKANSKQNEMS